MPSQIKATEVFEWNWDAIHEMAYNPDGSPTLDHHGKHQRRYRYILNKGSSRSSKTRSLCQIYWLYPLQNKEKRLSVWRDTKKDCKDTVGYDMKVIYPNMPFYRPDMYNKTESIYTFDNKSTIEICGTDDEEKVMGFNGHVAWLNEPYKISKDTFDQIDQRTEDFIIIDMNPKMDHWADDLEKDPRTLVIRSTYKNNKFCPPEQKRKIESYQPIGMCEAVTSKVITENEARIYNCEENVKKLTPKQVKELTRCKENENKKSASAYKWAVYGLGVKGERPNRIFNWIEIPDEQYFKLTAHRYYGSDWGKVDPWGVLESKYYDGALYLHELNYASENQIMESLSAEERAQISGVDEGLIGWWFNRIGVDKKSEIICDDNRPGKVVALREAGYDYAITAAKGPGSKIEGIDILDKITVYYTASSKNIAYEQENYSRKVDRYGTVLEEPEDFNDHLCDPARYIAIYLRQEGIIKII